MTEATGTVTPSPIEERLARIERANRFNEIWSVGMGMRQQISFALMLLGLGLFLPGLSVEGLSAQWLISMMGLATFVYGLYSTMAAYALRKQFVRHPTHVDGFMQEFNQELEDFEKSAFQYLLQRHDKPDHIQVLVNSLTIIKWIERHFVWVAFGYLLILATIYVAIRFWLP